MATPRVPTMAVLELGPQDVAALDAAGAKLKERCDLATDPETWVGEAHILHAELGERCRRRLGQFARFGNPGGALLVRGVPIGDVPPTPGHANDALALTLDAAAYLGVLIAGLGEQIGYRPERGGRLIHNVLPEREDEMEQNSTGSQVDLLMHVELAFTDFRPDFVCLLCLRQDHEAVAATTLSPTESVLPRLSDRTVEILRQQRFLAKVDASFLTTEQRAAKAKICIPVSALEGPEDRPIPRIDLAEVEPMAGDRQAAAAIERFGAAVEAVKYQVRLEPGDLLITDNLRALHGRTRYTPRYDGADRWLLRGWVVRDLRRSEALRTGGGRVISPDYSAEIALAQTKADLVPPHVGGSRA